MKNDYDFYNNVAETTTNERKANRKANRKATAKQPQTNANANQPSKQTAKQTTFNPERKPNRKNELHYQHEFQGCLSHLHECRIHGSC